MSKKMKIAIPILLSALVLPMITNADTTAIGEIIQGTLIEKGLSEEDIESELKQTKTNKIIEEFNELSRLSRGISNNNELIPYASEIFNRKDEFENEDIVDIIKDESFSEVTREMMVDLYIIKNERSRSANELKELLEEDIDESIKAKIVANSVFDCNETPILAEFVNEGDDILAFQSLKTLGKSDSDMANELSQEILFNHSNESTMKVSAAQKATVSYFKNNRLRRCNDEALKNEKDNFIDVCMEIFESTSDDILKDSSIFAISDLYDFKAISEIINSDDVDRELKVFCVDQNIITLKDRLLNDPTEEDIKIVLKAMEIFPVVDLIDEVEGIKEAIVDESLREKCEEVLNNMISNGEQANPKWMD